MDEKRIARFWSRVDTLGGPTGCWNWTRGCNGDGYGIFQHTTNRSMLAHRYAFLITHGQLPHPPLQLRHTCDNRKCVNPAHLLPGTNSDNIDDKMSRARQARGASHGRTILSVSTVIELRSRHQAGETIVAIANEMGINQNTAYFAATGRSWKHL